jgi:hypothetical protein
MKQKIGFILILIFTFAMGSCSCSNVKLAENNQNETELAQQHYYLENFNDKQLDNTSYDIPVVVNPKVSRWIDYFTKDKKGKACFDHYLLRAKKYIPQIQNVLLTEKIPNDLVFLALIESGYSNYSNSRAKAVGLWQFIKSTGERYGLRVNFWEDDRRDPERATLAAASYLKDLFKEFQDWNLAVAAYNCGEKRVEDAIVEGKTRDYWKLVEMNLLPKETSQYVSKLIAATILVKNLEVFNVMEYDQNHIGFWNRVANPQVLAMENEFKSDGVNSTILSTEHQITKIKEKDDYYSHIDPNILYFDTELVSVEVTQSVDLIQLSQTLGIPFSRFKEYNSHIVGWMSEPNTITIIKIPEDKIEIYQRDVEAKLAQYYPELMNIRFISFRNINSIARRYRIDKSIISELNQNVDFKTLKKNAMVYLPIPKLKKEEKFDLGFNSQRDKKRF